MRKSPRLFRWTATVALTALLWDAVVPVAAVAQPAPPPLPAPNEGRPDLNPNQADPPARVGRIASMTGAISFHDLGDTQWTAATPNYPVSSGNAFWTEPSAAAVLEVSASRVAMAGGTEFDVSTLDASGLQGVAAQGEIYVHLHDLAPNEVWSIQTPRGQVRLSGEGRYGIVVGTTDQPTLVTVMDGAAQIDGPGISLQVAGGQTATITGTDSFQGVVDPALRDAFLTASLDAERPPRAAAAPAPQQVYAMAGGSDLADTGSWSQAPDYGQVWYPPVPATWVPYREGHWAFVAPWGWTWVDDAPWGFAPFHYGRWIHIGDRWAWTPGEIAVREQPVYAPALVTFIGIGAGIALGAALASGSIGWVPLGPREQFHPWYHASNTYIRQVNVAHVTNITNNVTINNYVNRGAATSIPAAAMTASRPVQAVARPMTAQEFAGARPIAGVQPIRPTAATAGVTAVIARQMNLAPSAAAMRAAPGPAVRPAAAGAAGFARPTFAPVERAQAPGAVEPGRPGAGAAAGVTEPGRTVPGAAPGVRPNVVEPGRPGAGAAAGVTEPGRPVPAAAPGVRPNVIEPGRPGAGATAGSTEPGRPLTPSPGVRPAVIPAPQAERPTPAAPLVPRPAMPNVVRPEDARAPGGQPTSLGFAPQTAPRPAQLARPEAVPVEPRPAPMPAARPVPQPLPVPQPSIVRPTPQPAARPASPAFVPQQRPVPQRAAPPAVHPEPRAAAPARAQPQAHGKEPGER